MSGFFGCVSRNECVNEVFYGTDYHSHLGTKRAGMAFVKDGIFSRSIHSLEDGYFRNKFESELPKFGDAPMGMGIISDKEAQPIIVTSAIGRYAVVTVARIENIEELTKELLDKGHHFAELSGSTINATELVAILIGQGKSIKEGIELVHSKIKGSCSILVLTDHAIYAARDKFGRTPILIGKNDKGYVCASELYASLPTAYIRLQPLANASRFVHSFGYIMATPRLGMRVSTWRIAAMSAVPLWHVVTRMLSPTLWLESPTRV